MTRLLLDIHLLLWWLNDDPRLAGAVVAPVLLLIGDRLALHGLPSWLRGAG